MFTRSALRSGALFGLALGALTFSAFVTGCNDDSPMLPTDERQPTNSGVIRGELDPDAFQFEYVSTTNGDPTNPIEGPFAIRGRNIRYEADELVIDLSVANLGEHTYPEPVTLTFLTLQPGTVGFANPDTTDTGLGITFEFENDDALWTPGESSFDRPAHFTAGPGVAIGFVARIDVGMVEDGLGSIGGIVFDDLDGDGVFDPEEPGLADAMVMLESEGMDTRTVATAGDGSFRFDGLAAGFYTVTKMMAADETLTTDSPFYVTLVENEGVVSSFMGVQFGCMREDDDDDDENFTFGTPDFWIDFARWPVDEVEVGKMTWTREQAIGWMIQPQDDKTVVMFRELVAAILNEQAGAESDCIDDVVEDAHAWLVDHPLGSKVDGASVAWRAGEPLKDELARYNRGELCGPDRD